MAQKSTGISINSELFDRARQYLDNQRPAGTFSGLVEVALEDFLRGQTPQAAAPAHSPRKAVKPNFEDPTGRVDLYDISQPGEPRLVAANILEMEADKYWRRYLESGRPVEAMVA